ncbi:hypothetical protein pb186bvf_004477 [Paramecium bursaria]
MQSVGEIIKHKNILTSSNIGNPMDEQQDVFPNDECVSFTVSNLNSQNIGYQIQIIFFQGARLSGGSNMRGSDQLTYSQSQVADYITKAVSDVVDECSSPQISGGILQIIIKDIGGQSDQVKRQKFKNTIFDIIKSKDQIIERQAQELAQYQTASTATNKSNSSDTQQIEYLQTLLIQEQQSKEQYIQMIIQKLDNERTLQSQIEFLLKNQQDLSKQRLQHQQQLQDNQKLLDKLTDMNNHVQQLQIQNDTLQNEFRYIKVESQNKINEIRLHYERNNSDLHKMIEQKEQQIEQVKKELHDKSAEYQQKLNSFKDFHKILEEKNLIMDQLKKDLQDKTNKLDTLQKDYNHKISTYKFTIEQFKQDISEKDQKILADKLLIQSLNQKLIDDSQQNTERQFTISQNNKFHMSQLNDSVSVSESPQPVVGKEQLIQLYKNSTPKKSRTMNDQDAITKKKNEFVQVQKLQQGSGIQQQTISKKISRGDSRDK